MIKRFKTNLNKKQKIFSEKQKGFRDGSKKYSPKNKKDLGMACQLRNVEFRDGMGPRLGNGISPCFFTILRTGHP